ncbi:MAG: type II toxin-antitoxin system HicA family toxin [Acidimicrobiales bacterium]
MKALHHYDWYVHRIHGSHHILRHPAIQDVIPVPVHGARPIKSGTLANILRSARLTRDELHDALR